MIVYIDNNEIPASDIVSYPQLVAGSQNFDSAANKSIELVLNNCQNAYSDTNSDSIFYTEWADLDVKIEDDVNGVTLFEGNISELSQNNSDRTIVLTIKNFLKEISETVLIFSDSSTPAEAIYNMLIYAGISADKIDYSGFADVIASQTTDGVSITCTYAAKDNVKCVAAINELRRLSQCDLYFKANKIGITQYADWNEQLGILIDKNAIIPGSFRTQSEELKYNAYSVAYNGGAAVAFSTGTLAGTDGKKVFAVPDRDVKTTVPAEVKILCDDVGSASWCGELALDRYGYKTKTLTLDLKNEYNFLQVGDQIDLTYGDFYREPVLITKVSPEIKEKKVVIEGIFRNHPHTIVARDTTPPDPPELIAVLPLYHGLFIKWSQNTETDLLGYNIYFSTNPGEWLVEYSNYGVSPIEVKSPDTTYDGYNYLMLYDLVGGANFSVKVTAFDTSYNESDYSNTISNMTNTIATGENQYRISGSVYVGMPLDRTNSKSGSVPTRFTTYEDFATPEFDYVIASNYESQILYNPNGWTSIDWQGVGETSIIEFQYRTSADNVTWTSWSTAIDAIGFKSQTFASPIYLQYAFNFYSLYYSDADKIIVLGLT